MDSRVMSLRAQKWKQIIVACNTSGMKKADWMRLHGISEKSFYRWQTMLRDQVLKEAEGNQPVISEQVTASERSPRQDLIPGFVDMTALIAREDKYSTAVTPNDPPKQITPELMIQVGSYNLYIGSGVTEATLSTVLRVIGHA